MKLLKIQKYFKIFTDLNFALFILGIITISSSLGSFIEQDEAINFYKENYPIYDDVLTFGTKRRYYEGYLSGPRPRIINHSPEENFEVKGDSEDYFPNIDYLYRYYLLGPSRFRNDDDGN